MAKSRGLRAFACALAAFSVALASLAPAADYSAQRPLLSGAAPEAADTQPLFTAHSLPLDADSEPAYYTFSHASSPRHRLRIRRQNASLCDAGSAQWTGWLDIGAGEGDADVYTRGQHLFFWFFESQSARPAADPLTLWLTGGPGGSSMLGMLQELGPCLVTAEGNGTAHNRHGWSRDSNLLFVDQPGNVGFSYVDPGVPLPDDSQKAARDLHALLQIFVSAAFPEMRRVPLHLSGESYGGHYLPVLGATILEQNALYPHAVQLALASVLIGNGLFSMGDTAFGLWETLCTTNPGVPEPIFNRTRCAIIEDNLPRCLALSRVCDEHRDPAICNAAAAQVCNQGVVDLYDSESGAGGRNRFDITAPCEIDDFCYISTAHIQTYMNRPATRAALHIPENLTNFTVSSPEIGAAFGRTADFGSTTSAEVKRLLAQGVDVLIYQGNLDSACNTAGNLKWANALEWPGQPAFYAQRLEPWYMHGYNGGEDDEDDKTERSGGWKEGRREEKEKKKAVGTFKEVRVTTRKAAGSGKQTVRFAFVTVDGAGHMVPQDKPAAALDLLRTWLWDLPY